MSFTARPIVVFFALGGAGVLAVACSAQDPSHPDAGPVVESDAGVFEAGGSVDAGVHDSGIPDASIIDAGAVLTGPQKLSETGLYQDIVTRTLSPGVITFAPRFELWSDGAQKSRFLLLPDGQSIDTTTMDAWTFPVGTKAWKEFVRDGVLVETRLLWKVNEGPRGWFEMAYVWTPDGTEAFAAPDGVQNANGTAHDVPSQLGCRNCHLGVNDELIGVSALQLSRPGAGDGGLGDWALAGRLSQPPPGEYDVPGVGAIQPALGYLHGNCSHCHRAGNALALKKKLRLQIYTTDAAPEQTGAYLTTLNAKASHLFEGTTLIIVPGNPDQSQLYRRALVRDSTDTNSGDGFQMPPVCTEKPDDAGMQALRAWIEQL